MACHGQPPSFHHHNYTTLATGDGVLLLASHPQHMHQRSLVLIATYFKNFWISPCVLYNAHKSKHALLFAYSVNRYHS